MKKIGLFLILSFFYLSARAQWSTDISVNNPICVYSADQLFPIATIDGSGGAIIAWSDVRGGANYDIYLQRISGSGINQWASNGIPVCNQANDQISPVILSDSSGGAFVAWSNNTGGGIMWDVYIQHFNSAGVAQWGVGGLPLCALPNEQSYPTLAPDGAGGVIATWMDSRISLGSNHIYAQRINAAGVVQWTTDGVVVCNATPNQVLPEITSNGTGGAIITWKDYRNGSNYDLYAQNIDSNGNPIWTNNGVPICTAINDQTSPHIISDNQNGAIIVWEDERSGSDFDIYGQRINGSGIIQWAVDGIPICTAIRDQRFPSICSDQNAGVIASWNDERPLPYSDIYSQHINSAGVSQWALNGIAICNAPKAQSSCQIISNGSGGAKYAWMDYRDSVSGTCDLYAHEIDANGNLTGPSNGMIFCDANGGQADPIIVDGGGGTIIATWTDYRSGNADIYATKISQIIGIEDQFLSMSILFPNPTSDLLYIKTPIDGPVLVIISNLLGEVCYKKEIIFELGENQTIDLSMLPSGT